jgi:predicted transcriptional regulator
VKQTHRIRGAKQLRAMTSPLRMEILTQFLANRPLSTREIAERMGRPVTGIHYHVRVLEEAGLLVRAGERHEARRPEALYHPVARRFELPARQGQDSGKAALKSLSSAFRLAERDMEAALAADSPRRAGPDRNFYAMRMPLRVRPKDLGRLNAQLDRLMAIVIEISGRDEIPDDATEFCSLTLALMPLRKRGDASK